MIGEPYFELRARLGAALFSLSKVAEEAGVQPGRAVLLRQVVGSLKDPFLFVVAGEVNSGKSTFLNALFGEEFCETHVLPTTERIYYFKYGAESRDVVIDDSFVEQFRPNPFLRDFHIVDTPGTNSVAEGHQEITERFIPMADLVVFVFSVSNPWGASTWDFIEQIYDGWLKNVVFVLQQCDLRSQDEVHAIVEHLRVTARKRLNREFPVFAVSAKRAFVAKTSVHEHSGLLEGSGFPPLEEYISRMAVSTDGMQQKFRNALHTGRAIMGEVETSLRQTREVLEKDRRLLEALDAEITSQYKVTNSQLESQRQAVLEEFGSASERAAASLRSGTGLLATIFGKRGLVDRVESGLSDETEAAGRGRCDQAMLAIERDLPPLWQRLEAAIRRDYRVDLSVDDEAGRPKWLRAREGFADEMAEHCRGALLDSETVERMDYLVEARRTGVRAGAIGLFLAMILGGCGFVFHMPVLWMAGGGLGLIAGLGLVISALRRRKALWETFDERNTRARESLERALVTGFSMRMGKYYKEFLGVFEMVREFCESQRAEYQPLLDDMRNLGSTFDEIESELGKHAERAKQSLSGPT